MECYRYARDIAALDFCAITDTQSITKEIWAETVSAAQNMYKPGFFVTFQGTELGDNRNGHRNVIFSGDEPEPPVQAVSPDERGANVKETMTPNLHQRFSGRQDVILIPHHTKMWLSWDCYHPELEPVLEIHSIWGSGEKAGTDHWGLREMTGGAQEAWARGYRIGVVAGSDTHAGLPGRSLPAADREDFLSHRPGYAAVWAEELTRHGIFEALRARRCYGTTGVRIIVETFIEGHPMGSEIAWADPARHRELHINVWGTDELDQITVVKNNRDVHCFGVKLDQAEVVWCDRTLAVDGDYYYIRVVQKDGNRAWTSPVWIRTHSGP